MTLPAALAFALTLATPDAQPAGKRIDLGEAVLFIPDGFRPDGNRVDLLLHLHGASTVVEPALVAVAPRMVLIEFNRKGLSSVYSRPFSDPALFPRLLDQAMAAIKAEGIAPEPTPGRVIVSAFSAGFGGVRELLKVPEHAARIDTIVLADSLYCGYVGNPADRKVDPALMAGFVAFAREAAAGRKTLLVSHSAQVPEGYASTTETADDLLRAVGGKPEAVAADWGDGWLQTRSFRTGRFEVLGFDGTGPEDHMRHLRRIRELWQRVVVAP